MKRIYCFILLITISNIPVLAKGEIYETSWGRDATIMGSGLVNAFLSSTILPEPEILTKDEINSLNRNNVNSFDRFATYNYSKSLSNTSDVVVSGLIVSPALLLIDGKISNDFMNLSLMYAETLLWSVFIPNWTKETVGRIRPFVYNEEASLDEKYNSDNRRSFFSGHTTVAFSSAVFLSKVYSDYYPKSKSKYYVLGASILVASLVGGLRIGSGMHFPTDVLIGAVVGSSIGYIIPEIHRVNLLPDNSSITPIPLGISFVYTI
jgi:membrane-associated phospholipid phosphatase